MNTATTRLLATTGAVFGGIIMLLVGILQSLVGLAAIGQNAEFATVQNETFGMGLSTWGWLHFILGLLILITAIGVLFGQQWARSTGIGLVSLSVIANFFFLPHHWAWSLIVIVLGIFVIWSLARLVSDDT